MRVARRVVQAIDAAAVLFATRTAAQIYNTYNSITALSGTLDTSNPSIIGNYYNYWKTWNNKTTWDLTRSDRLPITMPKLIPMLGKRKEAMIEPSRAAYVIVDMQNYFLHPKLSLAATGGRNAVSPTLDMIHTFRANGMKVLWVNWGIDSYDLLTMPPAFLDTFSTNSQTDTSFCTDMGTLVEDDGTKVAMGGKLCRGSWNARPYGALWPAFQEGIRAGTDLLFHKNRFSGLWGAQTPLGLYLQESGITTLFISGVNSDQCVWSTLIDAFFKGFDIIYVEDCTATTSPWFAEEMARYNADLNGFVVNSTQVVEALQK